MLKYTIITEGDSDECINIFINSDLLASGLWWHNSKIMFRDISPPSLGEIAPLEKLIFIFTKHHRLIYCNFTDFYSSSSSGEYGYEVKGSSERTCGDKIYIFSWQLMVSEENYTRRSLH